MGKFDAAEVIKAAATSNLGVISLIVLVLAFLAWRFFQQSSDRVKLVVLPGGHMFYSRDDSRKAFRDDVEALMK